MKTLDNPTKNTAIEAIRELFPESQEITGDACAGDEIIFFKAQFTGGYKNATYLGHEMIKAVILKESYGSTGQHTFTLQLEDGKKTRIKGRNLYDVCVMCLNCNRAGRGDALDEKHARGGNARAKAKIEKSITFGV